MQNKRMMKVIVDRYEQNGVQTLGRCTVLDQTGKEVFRSFSIEKGWKDNQRGVSSIPSGSYSLVLEYSHRFKRKLWEIKRVPNRSETKFHAANYSRQLEGCIALGTGVKDIDNDGLTDVINSRKAMSGFHQALEGESQAVLIVNDAPGFHTSAA